MQKVFLVGNHDHIHLNSIGVPEDNHHDSNSVPHKGQNGI